MSKRTWNIGVVKVIEREKNHATVLAMGTKYRKQRNGRFSHGPALQLLGMQ
jgi:hypothetical protein